MPFYCKWWDCLLEDVAEHQQVDCEKNGKTCLQCMEQADAEETVDCSAGRIDKGGGCQTWCLNDIRKDPVIWSCWPMLSTEDARLAN